MPPVTLVVCETCRHPDDRLSNDSGGSAVPSGEVLRDLLRSRLEDVENVTIEGMRCLMACKRACTVHVRAPDRISYVLGDFPATVESADTLADYLRHYSQSNDGVVPFKDWPTGVKGRFIARIPPLPPATDEPSDAG